MNEHVNTAKPSFLGDLGGALRRGIRGAPRHEYVTARLRYADPDDLRRLVTARCRPDALRYLADIDGAVEGLLVLTRDADRDQAVFWVRDHLLVPMVTASGTLFLSWEATPGLLNRPVSDTDHTVQAWLEVPASTPAAARGRIEWAGWRLGTPRGGAAAA